MYERELTKIYRLLFQHVWLYKDFLQVYELNIYRGKLYHCYNLPHNFCYNVPQSTCTITKLLKANMRFDCSQTKTLFHS